MSDLFRIYESEECGEDGYPFAWHCESLVGARRFDAVKNIVRAHAGHRCVRCGHPYRSGEHPMESLLNPETGEIERTSWSRCDEGCSHGGPVRMRHGEGRWQKIPAEDLLFKAGGQLRYSNGSVCVDPASGRVLAPLVVEAPWRILTVHHLNGVKADLRWWNLASLCQRCHLRIQRTVVMPRVFPWEHTEWFKPYAAGWYAFAYLGLDLSRDETVERLDELLALERVA